MIFDATKCEQHIENAVLIPSIYFSLRIIIIRRKLKLEPLLQYWIATDAKEQKLQDNYN